MSAKFIKFGPSHSGQGTAGASGHAYSATSTAPNVQAGDLAYITHSNVLHPRLRGRIVKVVRLYDYIDPYFDTNGVAFGLPETVRDLAWWIEPSNGQPFVCSPKGAMRPNPMASYRFTRLPMADRCLRRIAGPTVAFANSEAIVEEGK